MAADYETPLHVLANRFEQWVAEHTPKRKSKSFIVGAGYPRKGCNLGVHASQVADAQQILEQHGTGAEFDRTGQPIITSKHHRLKVAEALGRYSYEPGRYQPKPHDEHYVEAEKATQTKKQRTKQVKNFIKQRVKTK